MRDFTILASTLVFSAVMAVLSASASAAWETRPEPAPPRVIPYDTNEGRVLVSGGFSDGLRISRDDGRSWESRPAPNPLAYITPGSSDDGTDRLEGDLYATFVTGETPSYLLCELRKTSDLGKTWTIVAAQSRACQVIFDPRFPDVMYGVGYDVFSGGFIGFYRSVDGGKSWAAPGGDSPAPSNPRIGPDQVVYGSHGYDLVVSFDRGATWQRRPIPGIGRALIQDLRAGRHPELGNRYVVVGTTNGLYESADAGITWGPVLLEGYGIQSMNVAFDSGSVPRLLTFKGAVAHWRKDRFDFLHDGLPDAVAFWPTADGHHVVFGSSLATCPDLSSCVGGSLASTASLVEFRDGNDHYFLTLEGNEAAALDRGEMGPWTRTGQSFRVSTDLRGRSYVVEWSSRFYGTPGLGPKAHFYGLAIDASSLRNDRGWTLETDRAFAVGRPDFAEPPGFWLDPPSACTVGHPIYRLYNNRFLQNDSGHRYVSDPALYKAMQAAGWIGEGVRFCEMP